MVQSVHWGQSYLCEAQWGHVEAGVMCRQLGFRSGEARQDRGKQRKTGNGRGMQRKTGKDRGGAEEDRGNQRKTGKDRERQRKTEGGKCRQGL